MITVVIMMKLLGLSDFVINEFTVLLIVFFLNSRVLRWISLYFGDVGI